MTEETLFGEALSRPAAERAVFLDQACAGRPELRAAVEALLAAHEKSGHPLDRPPAAPDPGATGERTPQPEDAPPAVVETTDHRPDAVPGAVIAGRYTLVEKIGEGGMGEVWVAKQTEPVKRKVALKLIKAGMDSRAVVQRFEQERQALALMDHPNIARVLDGGLTPDRRPFFVMELVNGLPLTRFCDEARLGVRARRELFASICQAVQHAHQKGVVHRDLKSANILVTVIDGRGVPKVIDFGVAKAVSGRLTDESLSTQFGAVVGTLEYMAPEQAGFAGEDIDTRADIYSLGVILYELLTGLRPIDAKRLHKAALAEVLRIIQEEEPSRPSARLSTDASAPSLAALRQTEPKKLTKLLRGELDWVVMKCLEKRRDRRYETASGLARDILRYLADEAVEARPPSARYRLGKFLKRNRGPVVAAGLLLLALVGGIAGTTSGWIEAHNKEAAAVAARNDLASKNTELEQSQAAIVGKNTEIIKKNTELEQSQYQLEGALARTWLSPLAEAPGPLSDAEIGALTEAASAGNERLADRLLAEALGSRERMRKLRVRAAFALQAVVGLNASKRQQVEGRLLRALDSPDLTDESRLDLALTASALGGLSPPAAAAVAQTLTQALTRLTDPRAIQALAQGLAAVLARLEPGEASRVAAQTAAALTQAITKEEVFDAREELAQCWSAVSAHLEPSEAAQAAATLTQAMTNANNRLALSQLVQGLSAVGAHLEPREAGDAAATLAQAMTRTNNGYVLLNLSKGLSAVSGRLEGKKAAEIAAAFTQAMTRTNDPTALGYLAQGLSAVSAHLEATEAARMSAQAAAMLTQAMTNTSDPSSLGLLAQGLSAVSAHLEPTEAARMSAQAAATLTQAMANPKNFSAFNALPSLLMGLSAVAPRLEAKEAAQAAATLSQAMNKTDNPYAFGRLAQGLSAVAARMEPREGAAALTLAMTKTDDSVALVDLAQGLSAFSARLEAREVGEAVATISQAMNKTDNPVHLEFLAKSLSGLAPRLEVKEARRVSAEAAATLTKHMARTSNPYALSDLAQGLSAVSANLEPKDAPGVAAHTATALLQALTDAKYATGWPTLVRGLSAASGCMEPREGAATLTLAMTKTSNPAALGYLAQGMSAILGDGRRLERTQAAAAAVGSLQDVQGLAGALALLQPAAEPLPRRLSDQDLVDLLKQPLCVGAARRVVLDHLEFRYDRPFADQWDFVHFAEGRRLGLDFTSPPKGR